MIRSISSSLPKFKDLRFRAGLNVVLADKSPGATDKQTRNGAGKTSLVELVHFLLGGTADKESLFRKPLIEDEEFTMTLDLGEGVAQVTRGGKTANKILAHFDHPSGAIFAFQSNEGESKLSNQQWRGVLGSLMFGLPFDADEDSSSVSSPTFRSLIPYFARRQPSGGFVTPVKQSEMQQLGDQQTSISFLLGLDWTIPASWQGIRQREKSLRELRKAAAEGALGNVIGSSAELRTQLTVLEESVRRLRDGLSRFLVVPEYEAIEREASSLTASIGDLANDNTIDRELVAQLTRALADEVPPDFGDVERLYREAGVVLPNLVGRRFDDVRSFHESVIRNRRSYLESELIGAERRMAEREREKIALDSRRARLMDVLRSGGALDHFSRLQSQLTEREVQAESLNQRYQAAQQLESEKTELEIERGRLLTRLRQDYQEQESTLKSAILAFENASEALYETAGRFQIEPTLNGPIFSVAIQGSASKGISNMQIFCFDLMLMELCANRGTGPRFLIHDSHLFDGVDSRQVARALQVGERAATRLGFQYIVTMNSDAVPNSFPDGFDFGAHVLPVRLTDEGETGGLFGLRFD